MGKKGEKLIHNLKVIGIFLLMFFGGIYIIAEVTWFHGSLIKELLGLRDTGNEIRQVDEERVEEHFVVRADDRVITDTVPESVCNRGIILRGPAESEGAYDFRLNTSGYGIWAEDYVCDCNLSQASSDDSFFAFCEDFSDIAEPYYPDTKQGSNVTAIYTVGRRYCQILRSEFYTLDISDGRVYMEGDPGYYAPVCYDPTGRYILLLNTGFDDDLEDFVLRFLEPGMDAVGVDTLSSDGFFTEDADEVAEVVEFMHSLEVLKVEEEMPELAMAENQITFSFHDVFGNINEYTLIGQYLIHGEDIYWIENPEGVYEAAEALIKEKE